MMVCLARTNNVGMTLCWSGSLSRESKSEYRTGQIPPGVEKYP
jgi:hypothetical protein